MGESLVEAPKIENKMGESVPCLQESVSFGRFEHDSLCWERWSTFPTNKYLEEVEKCSTPGSVAQKKAYFEAHYKKIAARKAELLDQEKKRETESMNSEDQSQSSCGSVCNTGEEDSDTEKSNTQSLATGNELENEEAEFTEEVTDAHIVLSSHCAESFDEESEAANFTSVVSGYIDEPNDRAGSAYENEDLQPQGVDVSEDSCPIMESPEMEKLEPIFVEEEGASTLELQDMDELPRDKVEKKEIADEEAQDVVKLDSLNKMQEELAQDMVEERNISEEEAEDVKKLDTSKEMQKELPLDKVEDREVTKKKNEDLMKSEKPRKMPKTLVQDKFEKRDVAKKETKAPVKLENAKKMQKEMVAKKTSTTDAKKKPTSPMPKNSSPMPKKLSPMPKLPALSTPKSLKPAVSKTTMSTIRSSVKKENGSTPLTSKKATRPESKRTLPGSLHMSLSLGSANSDAAALTTTRKSLIMEKMGDKDIVKRAFKAFQNFSHLSPSSLTKVPATNQFGDKKMERVSALDASQKKHEGIARAVKSSSPAPGRLGTKRTAVSPGLYKLDDVDKRNGNSLPASLGLRSQDQGHKQKECIMRSMMTCQVSKNLEQKSRAKEAGRAYLQSKVKLEKPAPVKTASRENPKTKLSSSYNQGHGFFKGLRKDTTKSQASG